MRGSEERRRIGDYEVLTDLHSGGMGSVYLARKITPHGFEKLVAIKTIRAELRAQHEFREMFLNEARLVARLHHPSIAQVYDFGEVDGDAYLVMEYAAGVSFEELHRLGSGGPLPVGAVCRAVAEVCRGLHAAHEIKDFSGAPLHVVHRDISPQNLMLTFDGGVKILDFGIARSRLRKAPVTAVGAVRGKPGYMAPEQLGSGEVDRRTDVFLVGIVLHELLTGKHLFEGDSFVALAHALTSQTIEPPSRARGDISGELDALVMRSLARDSGERFASAQAMAEALDAFAAILGGESLEAFAKRILADRERQHETRLRDLVSGAPPAKGRQAQIATRTIATRASRTPMVSAVLAVAIVVAGLWWWQQPTQVETAPTVEPTPAIAPAAEAAVVPPITPPAAAAAPKNKQHGRHNRRADASPEPAKSEGVAFLTVGAEPYAMVRINGQDIGTTPIFDRRVPAGRLNIELVAPDTRSVRLTRQLSLADGEHTRITIP